MLYRRAEFFKIEYPLTVDIIKKRIGKIKDKTRETKDKNHITRNITLECSFENRVEKDGNYFVGLNLEYQISPKKGVPYQKTRDFYAVIFFPKKNVLVVLGRDTAISEMLKLFSDILYPDTDLKYYRVFGSVVFGINSMIKAIKEMRKDDPSSWCDEYNGKHGAKKYQGKKTKSNFSLGEGNCVLDNKEAQGAIAAATSISPKFKFYKCPKLTHTVYEQPKTISFNGCNGVVSSSIPQDFDNWYRFISEFLIDRLEINS